MLIYICDDSRADQLRLVHNIESYAKEKGAAVTVQQRRRTPQGVRNFHGEARGHFP